MKVKKYDSLPLVRQYYETLDDLGRIINRSRVTVFRKLEKESFTQREKELIADDLIRRNLSSGVKETIELLFGR